MLFRPLHTDPKIIHCIHQTWTLPAAQQYLHCVSKNDTDVVHYNFNAHQPKKTLLWLATSLTLIISAVHFYPRLDEEQLSAAHFQTATVTDTVSDEENDGRQRSRRSAAMSRFFTLLGAQTRSFCKLTGEATVNFFVHEDKLNSMFRELLKQCRFRDTVYSMTEKTISGVHVAPGSADTLARRGGITNHHLTAYPLSNISAKNYQNWLMCVEVIVCHSSVVFLRHSVEFYVNRLLFASRCRPKSYAVSVFTRIF